MALGLVLVLGSVFGSRQNVSYAGIFGLNSQNIGLSSSLPFNLDSGHIGGGEIVIDNNALLSETGISGTSANIQDVPDSDQISIYVVRPGDSLSSIAQMFGVSVNTIIWANDLERTAPLREGQVLTILPVNGVQHVVTRGETVASIAKKFGGDIKEILQFNGLVTGTELTIGQTILIPGGEESEVVAVSPGTVKQRVRGSGGPNYAGYYLQPIAGGVKTQGLHGYNGIDLADSPGTEIMAAASGKVIVSKNGGWNGGYGSYVVIAHPNNTQTLYAHLQRGIVFVGQEIVRGQVLGYMGATGKATGVHLHFEVRGAKNPF